MLLVHGITQYMLATCYRLVHDDCIKCTVHVTDVSTWGLYTKCTICMLQVSTRWLYHLHNCKLRDWYNNIPNCDCEHGISYLIIVLIARDFVFQTSIVSVCISFFSFLLSYLQFEFLSVSMYLLSLWVSQFAVLCNCRCKLRPWTWTATRSSAGTHISVEVVMFLQLPNSC